MSKVSDNVRTSAPVALRYKHIDEIWTHVYYSLASCDYLSKKGIRYELLYTAPPAQTASVPDRDVIEALRVGLECARELAKVPGHKPAYAVALRDDVETLRKAVEKYGRYQFMSDAARRAVAPEAPTNG